MRRKRDEKGARLEKQRARETSEGLTFLEKVVLRVQPTRQVPAESGVQFAISSKAREDGLCLVFLIDDPEIPIVEAGPRPDYLVVHASKGGCLLTIVEMKGREQKAIEHGIEQIRAMYRRLRAEMAQCLPGSWRHAHIQGVLLMPEHAQVNLIRKKIDEAGKEGLQILPLQYHHQAELYPYISKPISRTEQYKHERLPRTRPELNRVEQLIAEGVLNKRLRDEFFHERRGGHDDTFFLSFRCEPDPKEAYASLSATIHDAIGGFSPGAADIKREVEAHLSTHELACPALRMLMI